MLQNKEEAMNKETLKKELIQAYADNERIRTIFDLANKKINFGAMKKIKKIFDEIGVEKLEETCIVCKEKFKVAIVKNFLKFVKTQRPVKFL